jgi:hypothetical protein
VAVRALVVPMNTASAAAAGGANSSAGERQSVCGHCLDPAVCSTVRCAFSVFALCVSVPLLNLQTPVSCRAVSCRAVLCCVLRHHLSCDPHLELCAQDSLDTTQQQQQQQQQQWCTSLWQ